MMPPHQSAVSTLTQEVLTDPDLAMMTHPIHCLLQVGLQDLSDAGTTAMICQA